MNICVFCSSSEGLASEYYEAGFAVGKLIAKGGHTLVFGGYTKGIMGAVAKGCQDNGGKVISVIPAIFIYSDIGKVYSSKSLCIYFSSILLLARTAPNLPVADLQEFHLQDVWLNP